MPIKAAAILASSSSGRDEDTVGTGVGGEAGGCVGAKEGAGVGELVAGEGAGDGAGVGEIVGPGAGADGDIADEMSGGRCWSACFFRVSNGEGGFNTLRLGHGRSEGQATCDEVDRDGVTNSHTKVLGYESYPTQVSFFRNTTSLLYLSPQSAHGKEW